MQPILVINTGSSTFKWTLFADGNEQPLESGTEEWTADDALRRKAQIEEKLQSLPRCRAVGHRIVHGGSVFTEPTSIDDGVHHELMKLVALDTLHMRPAMIGVDAAMAAFPNARQVACFDTAFHRTLPEAAAGYALPAEWSLKWNLRKYGFHGLSVQWSVDWLQRYHAPLPPRVIVAHLGSGCSVTAVLKGASVDTTMGATPLDGLMMATRAGSVDPGLLIHLQQQNGISLIDLEDALNHKSGLLGVSGVSGDLRKVIVAADAGDANAKLAYDRFILSARRGVGAMRGVLGGADMLVFTGGIGEHLPRVRKDIAAALGDDCVDDILNESIAEGEISQKVSGTRTMVVRAREDVVVLREVLRLGG